MNPGHGRHLVGPGPGGVDILTGFDLKGVASSSVPDPGRLDMAFMGNEPFHMGIAKDKCPVFLRICRIVQREPEGIHHGVPDCKHRLDILGQAGFHLLCLCNTNRLTEYSAFAA